MRQNLRRRIYGLNTTISNCSNNYGPYQFPEKLTPLCIMNLLHGKPLPIYGDGLNVRDWLHVEDHCRGIERILEAGEAGETYNIGGNSEHTNVQVAGSLCSLMDKLYSSDAPHSRHIQFVTDGPGHDRRYAIECKKIHRDLGWESKGQFIERLGETVSWYVDNESQCAQLVQDGIPP